MNTENKQELYVSPQVEVYEIKARQVICQSQQSGNSLNDYPGTEW